VVAQGIGRLAPHGMTASPRWTARHWSPVTDRGWPPDGWVAERMTIGDDTWFARTAPDGDPALPPIVMLHGLVVSGAYFRPVATRLDTRYRMFIPDLPGYGQSSSSHIWTLPEMATHVARWMDAHELGPSLIVGNSLGCQVATWLAVERPDLVIGLVLVAPTMDPAVCGPLGVMVRGAMDIPRERQSLWRIWIPDLLRSGVRRAISTLLISVEDDQRARLPRVHQPALVIGGGRDPIVPPDWVHGMAGQLPRARAMILPGSPHAMNYSSARDLARAIDTAVTGHFEQAP
jgi:2-hydroxy-6-oxonona-2,4-dienedioate hydrolase